MKKIYTLITVLAALLTGCSQEIEDMATTAGTEVSTILFSADGFGGETRTSINANGYTVSWTAGDKVGIFPMTTNDNQVAFDISKGAKSSHASFDGKGWGVKNGVQYAAYYPLKSDALLDKSNVELNYLGQVQNGNGNTDHLGAYDFLMTSPIEAVGGVADFKFNHLGALLKIELQVPVAASWRSLTLHSSNEKFIEKSTVDLSTGALTVTESSSSITLGLKGVTTTSSQKTITAYMMAGVGEKGYVNFSASTLTAWITDDSGKEYVIEVDNSKSSHLKKNEVYTLSSAETTSVMKDASQNVAKLVNGITFNKSIKSLVSGSTVANTGVEDEIVQSIIFYADSSFDPSDICSERIEVSASDSPVKAYAYKMDLLGDGMIWVHTPGYRFEANSSCTFMFNHFNTLTSLNLNKLDTHNVTNMHAMFQSCSSLTELELSSFDTHNVTDMGYMFNYNNSLSNLDLSSFDTRNVTNMSYMFNRCNSLSNLDLSSFDTRNVTDMSYMFNDCSSLLELDLSSFDTRNVTTMSPMFQDCSSLTELDLSHFDTRNVIDMGFMFNRCNSLSNLDLSSFDTRNVTEMRYMFANCPSLYKLDLSSFNTAEVTEMSGMFKGCTKMTDLNITNFSIGSSVTKADMFKSFASEYSRMPSIYCSQAVYDVLNSSSSETGLDTSKVLWPFIQ